MLKKMRAWGEQNTAVTLFLETFKERQKTFLFCSFLLHGLNF